MASSMAAITAVLSREDKGRQRQVYFVSQTLHNAELRYESLEKRALALVHIAQKLWSYFQSHPIKVLTNSPLRQVLLKPEASGRLIKWAIELYEHDIEYYSRKAIKGLVLADFLAETLLPHRRMSPEDKTPSRHLKRPLPTLGRCMWMNPQ